jgi:hypothetical protein
MALVNRRRVGTLRDGYGLAKEFSNAMEVGPMTLGRAVQLDPMKPTLTAPGSKRLKLQYDETA